MFSLLKKITRQFVPGLILAVALMSIALVVFAQAKVVYLPVAAGGVAASTPQQPTDDPKQAAIDLAAAQPEVALYLSGFASWRADAWQEDESSTVWFIDFYDVAKDEWIGNARVDVALAQVLEYYAPRELTSEEFQAGQAKIEAYLPYDAEVTARMGNPDLWYHTVTYDRWESNWKVYYARGLDEFVVLMNMDENGEVYLDQITDPYLFEEKEAAELARNQAIELAYSAPGLDAALEGRDHWRTYAEQQDGARWSVAFVADEQQLFSALVDIESWQVLESGAE